MEQLKSKLEFNICEYNQAYNHVDLYIDPEYREIFTHGSVGNHEIPGRAWGDGPAVYIGRMPRDYVAASLKSWLEMSSHVDAVLNAWDSDQNRWNLDDDDLSERIEALSDAVSCAFDDGRIATYWKAGDWLEPLLDSERYELALKQPRGEVLDDLLFEAEHEGCFICRDDLDEYLDGVLNKKGGRDEG